jgi:hypothetical protein
VTAPAFPTLAAAFGNGVGFVRGRAETWVGRLLPERAELTEVLRDVLLGWGGGPLLDRRGAQSVPPAPACSPSAQTGK